MPGPEYSDQPISAQALSAAPAKKPRAPIAIFAERFIMTPFRGTPERPAVFKTIGLGAWFDFCVSAKIRNFVSGQPLKQSIS